jgi:GBP family porin
LFHSIKQRESASIDEASRDAGVQLNHDKTRTTKMDSKGLVKRRVAKALAGAGMGAALCAHAMAQSSVTLYGIVDSGITYTNNQKGSSTWQATGGNEQGTRWGLLGKEDLGGGTSAVFKLENGFNIETGAASQNGRIFGRQAWVGLSNDRWGTFTMGRQYNAAQDSLAPLQIGASISLTQYALHPFDTDDLNNSFRTDNSVKYVTPTLAGFQGNAMYGFSNETNFAQNRSWSLGGTYGTGPLHLGVAYVVLDNPALDTTGAIPSDNYYTFLKGITKQQIWGAGGTYDYANATFGLLCKAAPRSVSTTTKAASAIASRRRCSSPSARRTRRFIRHRA